MLEEFYNKAELDDDDVIRFFYVSTLEFWLVYNDDDIYYNILNHFENMEYYTACSGIQKAIKFIEKTIQKRFSNAAGTTYDEHTMIYDAEEYKKLSRQIFEDIIIEIYEEKIRSVEESS